MSNPKKGTVAEVLPDEIEFRPWIDPRVLILGLVVRWRMLLGVFLFSLVFFGVVLHYATANSMKNY